MRKIKIFKIIMILITGSLSVSLQATKLKVIAAYPYIASITQEIGGNSLEVESLANGKWDPHFVVPRPSYISKLRNADLLIINGGDLEVGWIPPLVSQAGNSKLNGEGTLDLSHFVELQEVPHDISRKMGDVHPSGNPHFHLDPYNILPIAQAIGKRLIKLDPDHATDYDNGLKVFVQKWKEHLESWNKSMAAIKGQPVVQYHNLFHYLLHRFQISSEGTIEKLPGIPPTAEHIVAIEKIIREHNIKRILQDVYHPDEAAKHLTKSNKLKLVYLPHDVGALPHTENIFALFDEIVRRLTHD